VLPHRELLPGVEVETDLGRWQVYETPGHAPSHVVLFQAERRLLVSGDHVLGRVSLYFDYGYTPDPLAEFVHSLAIVEALGARLCLPGHGRPFADVQGRISANRAEVELRLDRTARAIAERERTPYDLVPHVFEQELDPMLVGWMLTMMLCFLHHLERTGRAQRIAPDGPGEPERWRAPASAKARAG
jgi:glyoxylase-like metal-dependent hydrolase (beta-lactamase superfamily II)